MTKGTDGKTIDAMSLNRIDGIIAFILILGGAFWILNETSRAVCPAKCFETFSILKSSIGVLHSLNKTFFHPQI